MTPPAATPLDQPPPFASIAFDTPNARRRRSGFQMGFQGVRVSSDVLSLMQDALFALATMVALSDLRLPGHLPLFILFIPFLLAANIKSLMNLRMSARAFVLPLFVFMCIHLSSAFRLGIANGLLFVLQASIVSLFVWAFVTRYSRVPMRHYFKFSGVLIGLLTLWVVGYHLAHHHISSWKLLGGVKCVFDLLPLTLLVVRFGKSQQSKAMFPFLLSVSTILVLLSGERKAYILLALASPFLINFRSPVVYLSILVIGLAVPSAGKLEKSGYVNRQLATLTGFASGKVERTNSNIERASAVKYAAILFKKHPFWGVGTNAYIRIAQRQFEEGANATHNDWMRVSAENGIIGLFFYAMTVLYGLVGLFRRRVWGRIRSNTEMIVAAMFYITLLMYVSFEAYQFLLLLAFCFLPFVQYLHLDPNEDGDHHTSSKLAARLRQRRHRRDFADNGRSAIAA